MLCQAHEWWQWGFPWVTHRATTSDGKVSVSFFSTQTHFWLGEEKNPYPTPSNNISHSTHVALTTEGENSSTARRLRRGRGTAWRGQIWGSCAGRWAQSPRAGTRGTLRSDRNRGCLDQSWLGNINQGTHSFRRAAPAGGSNQHPFPQNPATYTSYIYTYMSCVIYTPRAGQWKCTLSPLDVTPPHHSPGFGDTPGPGWGSLRGP